MMNTRSYDNTIETTLHKDRIGLIIGREAVNINKYIIDASKVKYCEQMNQGNPDDYELYVNFVEKEDNKIYACWNNIDEVEMRIFNPILKKSISKEVTKINEFKEKPKAKLKVYKEKNSSSSVEYVIKTNVGQNSVSKMIGKNGCNCSYLKEMIREKINKCGPIFIKIADTQQSDAKFYNYSEPFDGGNHEAWIYVSILDSKKVFGLVMECIKDYMSELFDVDEEKEDEDEYETYDKSDW